MADADKETSVDTGADKGQTPSTATAEAKPKRQRRASSKKKPTKPLPPWKVLLHNDDHNEMGYVVQTIVDLTPLNPERAIVCMAEAHKSGLALLLTTHRERAELYQEQFTSKGLTVTIEAAEK